MFCVFAAPSSRMLFIPTFDFFFMKAFFRFLICIVFFFVHLPVIHLYAMVELFPFSEFCVALHRRRCYYYGCCSVTLAAEPTIYSLPVSVPSLLFSPLLLLVICWWLLSIFFSTCHICDCISRKSFFTCYRGTCVNDDTLL